MKQNHRERGFIALMSTLVISATLLMLVVGAGMASWYAQHDSLGIENKRSSQTFAESCVNVVLLALASSTDALHYVTHNQTVVIGDDSRGNVLMCVIKDVTHHGYQVTIETYAQSGNSFSTASVVASLSPQIRIVSWSVR